MFNKGQKGHFSLFLQIFEKIDFSKNFQNFSKSAKKVIFSLFCKFLKNFQNFSKSAKKAIFSLFQKFSKKSVLLANALNLQSQADRLAE